MSTKKSNNTKNNKNLDIKNAPLKAPLSVFNNPQFSEDILVRGNGLIRETLACFQMISRVLKIPIRKDSLKKFLDVINYCRNQNWY